LSRYAVLARLDQLLALPPSPAHVQQVESLINEQQLYLEDNPSDLSTQAVLAALHCLSSPAEAARYSSSLPAISAFTNQVDVGQLEAQGIPTAAPALASLKRKSASRLRPRKHRVRGGKEFDHTQAVDPERWLALRDRSYFKPSKTKKRKTGGATQGGMVEAENMVRTGSGVVEAKKPDANKKKKKNRK